MNRSVRTGLVATCLLAGCAGPAMAQYGFGVNSSGTLFRFPLNNPSSVTTIGPVGFVPEGIDFRPGTSDLYAIDVASGGSQLYQINVTTGAATAIGAAFSNTGGGGAGPAYDLTGTQTFGFDFNPTTLQADTSMRIRLVSSGGSNLRLNSNTGSVAAIDTPLSYSGSTQTPSVDAAAYINSASATAGGTTALYVMDYSNNQLALQNPPNAGVLNVVGPFGVTITALSNVGFDILTDPSSVDPGIGGDSAYAVLRRPDAPIGGPLGAYLMYSVNLSTGQITNGALVGSQQSPMDFVGGFAVNQEIPAPGVLGCAIAACGGLLRRRRLSRA